MFLVRAFPYFIAAYFVAMTSDNAGIVNPTINFRGTIMAILQKLETSYLAILRFVVISFSGLLLVATLILSVTALVNLRDGAKSGQPAPKVTPDQIITELTKTPAKPGAPAAKLAAQVPQSPVDPNHAEYERAVNIIAPFVSKYGRGVEVIKESVIEIVKGRAETQPTHELANAFASGLPGILEKVLSDKKVIELVSRTIWAVPGDGIPQNDTTVGKSPISIVDMTLNRYSEMFNQQAEQARVEEESSMAEQAVRKERAMLNLYIAAATFGAFLLLALLSIIVRVERNLRPLTHLADKACKAE